MAGADTASKPPRGRTIALVISLALNLLLIGIVAAGALRAANRAFIAQPGGVLAPGAVMRDLPEARRQAIRAVQIKHRDAMRADRQRARRARLAAFRAFAAPDYDPLVFDKALADVEDADRALEDEAIAMVKDVVATLTPDERKAVAEKAHRRAVWWRRWLRN